MNLLKNLILASTLALGAVAAHAQARDYSTLPAGVAWHAASALRLGPTWTAEAGPGADINDGVAPSLLTRGAAATITLNVSAPGIAQVWIDMNGNGLFEPVELVIADAPLGFAGIHVLGLTVPLAPAAGARFARVRVSNQYGLSPVGGAQSGEVSDFIWWVN